MLKRKSFIYFTMVIALLGVFMAAIAIAQAQDPGAADSCTAGNYTLKALRTNGEFPVKATCSSSPDGSDPFPCYKYEYEYTSGDVSKIDHVYMAISYDPYDPITVYAPVHEVLDTGTEYWTYSVDGPCVGATSDSFGDFVCSAIVITVQPQGNKLTFFASTARNGTGSHYISAGKKKYGCDTPIIAAGYYPERPKGPLASIECISINERLTMGLERGPDGCEVDATLVKFWLDNPTCAENTGTPLSTTIGASTDLVCAGLNDQGCPECITGSGGNSPTKFSYTTASGYKVTICYDLDNPYPYACD